ncbi:MAG TPA: SpoIIE family protein phosphatase [Porticoccaceae bacterium]|nr:SpoIIE family protein phosphatase [Porticoccaceae bacterium]
MTTPAKRILLILPEVALAHRLRGLLVAEGWEVDERSVMEAFPLPTCANYQVVVIASGLGGVGEVGALLAQCPEYNAALILPILRATSASAADVVALIRSGVVDVLLDPFSDHEFVETVNRVAGHKNLYLENLAYSEELEKTNRELKESLNILKMDQIAGRQVQKSLLPVSPLVHGEYRVAHRINPSLYLSGDFVGYNVVLDRFLIFYLADVSGHGASSAFVTILLRFILKRILRKHTYENDVTALLRAPEGFMEHLNRQIIAAGLEKHLTMFAGSINLDTHILRYSVAAQMPMPVFVADGDARFLPGKGKPIGLFEHAQWEVEEIALPDNFALYMASDGLLETLPGKTLEAREDYLLKAAAEAGDDHEVLCERLGFNDNAETADDMSLLSVLRRRTPGGEPRE